VKQTQIVILDKQALSRNGLRMLVEQIGVSAGQVQDFADTDTLVAHLETVSVRMLLLSDQLPAQQRAVKLVHDLHQHYPGLAQVVIGSRLNTDYIGALFTAGARGYVYHKSKLEETIPLAIKSMMAGETYLSSEAAALPYQQRSMGELSERDLEVLSLLAVGQSVGNIADGMDVSRRVIYNTRTRIKKYLNVNNNEQIIPAAAAYGLLKE
jgi:DNA-binding NarL/FixJ family response regulator